MRRIPAHRTIAISLIGVLALSIISVSPVFNFIAFNSLAVQNAFAQSQSSSIGANVSGSAEIVANNSNANASVNASASTNSSANAGESQQQQGQSGSAGAATSAQAKTMYKPEYPKATADARTSMVLQTDQRLYKPGEQVTIEGSIWSNLLTQLGEEVDVITIEVADNRGTVVANEEVQIENTGEYSMTFTLPNDARLGAYTINTNIDVDANVLATLDASLMAKIKASSRFVVVSPMAFAVNAEGKQFDVSVASNSSRVDDFAFAQAEKKVSFVVEGETGTRGVAQVTLPKELLSGQLIVAIDGRVIAEDSNDVIVTSDTNSEMTLEINYPHSEHTIEITGTNVVPEFPVSMLVMAGAIGSIVAVLAIKSKGVRFNRLL